MDVDATGLDATDDVPEGAHQIRVLQRHNAAAGIAFPQPVVTNATADTDSDSPWIGRTE